MTVIMLSVVAVVFAIVGVWALAAIAFAFLAGGIIHARDQYDAPYGGFPARRVPVVANRTRFTP